MKEYNIGQVLFVLLKGDTNIHPVMVVEEVKKKTLQGASTEYTVEIVLKGGKRNRVPLSELDATVFDNLDNAREQLVLNATNAIQRICDVAAASAKKNFSGVSDPVVPRKQIENDLNDDDTGNDTIILDNGVKARIILPPGL
jgi:hypothetical protein